MSPGASRRLTAEEWSVLSPGLVEALAAAGATPVILARAHPGARVAALWHGAVPILTRGGRIFWPRAPEDVTEAGDSLIAVLQHELQHVLDYATGALTGAGYLANPRNWSYAYRLAPACRWSDFGAEQRASIAEHHWLLERGRPDLVERAMGGEPPDRSWYDAVIPWRRTPRSPRLAPP